MDEWTPSREEHVDEEWIERELGRLQREAERHERTVDVEIINGATREADGPFAMLPHRVFRTDGRNELSAEQLMKRLRRILYTARRSRSVEPVVALQAAKAMRRACDEFEYEAVAIARGCGWPWRAVAEVLGISESTAHRRFARSDPKPPRRRPEPS